MRLAASCATQALLLLLGGCHWILSYQSAPDTRARPRDVGVTPGDASATVPDAPLDAPVPTDATLVDVRRCSATGVLADCNPFNPQSCAVGSCYLTKGQGPACVCEAGTLVAGQGCNTTPNCQPRTVCAGTSAPGICRPLCTTSDPGHLCPAPILCRAIDGFASYGYCDPDAGAAK